MSTIITPAPAHQKPSGKLYLSANQLNLVHREYSIIELDAISAGFTDSIENTTLHRITPGVAGFYDVKAQLGFLSIVPNYIYWFGVRLSGTAFMSHVAGQPSLTTYLTLSCGLLLYLSATDYVDMLVYPDCDVNTVDIFGGEARTFLSVQRVR